MVKADLGGDLEEHFNVYSRLNYLNAFTFYTENDKWFRYLRDQVLDVQNYEQLMLQLMTLKGFLANDVIGNLWMSEDNLKDVANRGGGGGGHLVGLHSYSHPTQMSKLSYKDQYSQYKKNLDHLNAVVGEVVCMSHPCGDYNKDTLTILDDIGIRIGFRSSLSEKTIKGKFEIPRDDHANIYKAMKL